MAKITLFMPKSANVNSHFRLPLVVQPFREAVGKQLPNPLDILIHDVRGLHV